MILSIARQTRAEVGERLAHPHEHDVIEPAPRVPGRPCRQHDLLDDLTGRELPDEAGVAGRAERAGHRATGLGRDARRGVARVVHQDGFDRVPVGKGEEPFERRPGVGDELVFDAERGRERRCRRQPLPERLRQDAQLGRVREPAVEPLPELDGPVAGQVGEELGDLVPVEVVAAHRVGSTSTT